MNRWFVVIVAYIISLPCFANPVFAGQHEPTRQSAQLSQILLFQGFVGENIGKDICYSISADNRREFQNIIDRHNLRIRGMYTAIRCNGLTLLQFAIIAEAADTGLLLTRNLPIRLILEHDDSGHTILEWAETTGYGNSAIIRAIRERS